ncbi:MAG: beta-ketoacyl-ACP synthase III [Phycisphaerae bacterium]|jgi:3-oxoacyl-[acyl-carrier-protein] synthase-3
MNKEVDGRFTAYRAVIAGTGAYVPEKILTNEDLAKRCDIETSDEWITTRTGIKRRHIAAENETTADLATEAAKKALEEAEIEGKDLDLIIVATITPEMVFPSTASFVQTRVGAKKAFVFDLAAACSGFVYSMAIASQMLESGKYNNALIIGAETLSKITNWKDRTSCILFGDGAGAVVLKRAEHSSRGVMYSTMGADGYSWRALNCQAYGSRHPSHKELENPDMIFMEIHGREVYQQAVRKIVTTVQKSLRKCGLKVDDVAMMVSHQMNARIIESAAKRLNLPDDKYFVNIQEYGNTSAASLPIAFDDCRRQGKIKEGDIVVLVAFGAGLTWGANVVQL